MKEGNVEKKFTELYNAEADTIFRFCLLRTSEKEVALDITQDTFMRLWNELSRHAEIRNHRAFIFTVARNLIIDWYRKKKPVSLEALVGDDNLDRADFFISSGREEIEMEIEARHLIEKIRKLDHVYQEVVYLRFVEDLKPKEIALILGKSVNLVSVRINRGLTKLREIAGYENE